MCGRYAAAKDQADLVLEFDVELVATAEPSRSILVNPQEPPAGTPDHNMAPTKQAPVVLTRAPRDHRNQPDRPAVRQLRLLTLAWCPAGPRTPRWGYG